MRKKSLAQAKANLATLVDDTEHRRERIIILRRGKPAAALVPVDVALSAPSRRTFTESEIEGVFANLGKTSTDLSAVDDLIASRR